MRAVNVHQQTCRPPSQQSAAVTAQPRSVQRGSRCSSTAQDQPACSSHTLHKQHTPQAEQLQKLQWQQHQSSSGSSSSRDGSSTGRRGMLNLLGAAVAAATLSGIAVQPAAAAGAVSSSTALEEYMKLEDQNKLKDQRSLDNIRCGGCGLVRCQGCSMRCSQAIDCKHLDQRCSSLPAYVNRLRRG